MASAAYQVITHGSCKLPTDIVEDGSDIWRMGSYTSYITNGDIPATNTCLSSTKSKRALEV